MSGEPDLPRFVGRRAALLGVFAALASALLTIGDAATRESIAERRREDLLSSLDQIIPPRLHDQGLLDHALALPGPRDAPRTVYRAVLDGRVTAVAFRMRGAGYAGPIELLMGVDARGEILGVRVVAHSETPGLGDRIEVEKDDWILGFSGRSLGDPPAERWGVRKHGGFFDQFTGATITPRAVVAAVKDGLAFFAEHRGELLGRAPADGAGSAGGA